MKSNYKQLGQFIRQVDVRNAAGKEENLLGVSVQKTFIPSIANTVGTDFTKYKVVRRGQFTYIPDTSRRGDKIGIALLSDYEEGLVSNVYTTFALDVDAMRQAASYLVGMHDFKSFATAKPEVTDTVRTIYETSLEKEDDLIRFRITGNGFLYNMVRIITGTLLEVGKGDYPPEKVKEILAAKDRKMAGATARPEGLTLVQIRYPEWDFE